MDASEYTAMSRVEATHPWFVQRRRLVRGLIERFAPKPPLRLLDAGCGTGANLADYARWGAVFGLEFDGTAAAMCRGVEASARVVKGDLCRLPFAEAVFDLIVSTDVIEHIEQDVAALREMSRVLAARGRIVLTTPAYAWAYSSHDRHLHHVRRYSAARLRSAFRDAGLRVLHRSRYNALLATPVLAIRLLRGDTAESDVGRPLPPVVSAVFSGIWRTEAVLARWVNLGVGMTHVAVLAK